jgi:hypothetical protein
MVAKCLAIRPDTNDANLVIMRSNNPYIKTSILRKPSKSGLIGVWHKDNLYLGTSTIRNGNPQPMNINSRTRSIRMTPQSQLFFDKSFFSSLEKQGRKIIPPTHNKCGKRSLLIWKLCNLTCLVTPLFILILDWNKP